MRKASKKYITDKKRVQKINLELKHLRYQNYHSNLTVVGIEMKRVVRTPTQANEVSAILVGLKSSIEARGLRISQLKSERLMIKNKEV